MTCRDCNNTCSCAIGAGDGSIAVTGNGNGASPYRVTVNLSSVVDNALELTPDGLYISAVSATISGGIIICTSTTRPPGVQGRVIIETNTDRMLVFDDGAWRGLHHLTRPHSLYQGYEGQLIPIPTSKTLIFTATGMPVTPYPLRMVVRASGYIGNSNLENISTLTMADEDGVTLNPPHSAEIIAHNSGGISRYTPVSMFGTKTYAAGVQTGFQMYYEGDNDDSSNILVRFGFELEFNPV